ncbi:MAG: Rieske 2Fe-2S domain-containing protein [Actinobacteria bacterium]|nr:Rieske 2Fe-2S domain-containing protein [Actinomycetota bacterium]
MAELQKDPMTRGDFLGFGILGTIVGAILTIPPAAFVLGPLIDSDIRGQSDIPSGPDDWFEVASISEVSESEPKVFTVDFPVEQVYGKPEIQEESKTSSEEFVVPSAIWLSWEHEINADGTYGQSLRPSFLDEKSDGFSESEIEEIQNGLNVLSSSCAHLGCPVRWLVREGEGEFLCPCHGGIYNINGEYVAGPPPRDMYSYDFEVREDGSVYVRHEFDTGGPNGPQEPYVI